MCSYCFVRASSWPAPGASGPAPMCAFPFLSGTLSCSAALSPVYNYLPSSALPIGQSFRWLSLPCFGRARSCPAGPRVTPCVSGAFVSLALSSPSPSHPRRPRRHHTSSLSWLDRTSACVRSQRSAPTYRCGVLGARRIPCSFVTVSARSPLRPSLGCSVWRDARPASMSLASPATVCLRIGGTSHGASVGMSELQLCQAGRWSSRAVRRYVRQPTSVLQAT